MDFYSSYANVRHATPTSPALWRAQPTVEDDTATLYEVGLSESCYLEKIVNAL